MDHTGFEFGVALKATLPFARSREASEQAQPPPLIPHNAPLALQSLRREAYPPFARSNKQHTSVPSNSRRASRMSGNQQDGTTGLISR